MATKKATLDDLVSTLLKVAKILERKLGDADEWAAIYRENQALQRREVEALEGIEVALTSLARREAPYPQ